MMMEDFICPFPPLPLTLNAIHFMFRIDSGGGRGGGGERKEAKALEDSINFRVAEVIERKQKPPVDNAKNGRKSRGGKKEKEQRMSWIK